MEQVSRPSDETGGRIRRFLEYVEEYNPGLFHDGTSYRTWRACTVYVDCYINKIPTTQSEVGWEYDVEQHTISENYPRVVALDALDYFYANELIIRDAHLGALLRTVRLPRPALGVATGKASRSIGRALSALERKDENHNLIIEDFGGREFVTTEEP